MSIRSRRKASEPPLGQAAPIAERVVRALRALCLLAAAVLLTGVGAARLHSALSSQADLERFRQAKESGVLQASGVETAGTAGPDQSLWDEGRVAAYQASLAADLGLPLAVLRIPRLALEVPIWEGVDELTLNRGLGHIPGTVPPTGRGNIGIAGHRDGFFRVLKEIRPGDEIEVETLAETRQFVVERTLIVKPEDVWVLDPTDEASLTLVTCHPFYFSGKAPERFIVRAAGRAIRRDPPEAEPRSTQDPGPRLD